MTDVYLSYMGLRSASSAEAPWRRITSRPARDAAARRGAYTVNKDTAAFTEDDLLEISAAQRGVRRREYRPPACGDEFDALALGQEGSNAQARGL